MVGKNFSLGTMNKHALIQQQKWELLDLVECVTLASYDSNKVLLNIPKICFKCYACRRPFYYYANAYFLLFLVTLTSLCVFSIDCYNPQNRLQTTETILLILVLLKWTTSRSLPPISYTTSLDLYSIISMIFLCVLIGWHSIIGVISADNMSANKIDAWMLIVFSLIFTSYNIYFLTVGIKKYLYVCGIEKRRIVKSKQKKPQLKKNQTNEQIKKRTICKTSKLTSV